MNPQPNVQRGGACFEQSPLFSAHNRLFLLNDEESIREQVGNVFKPHELVATSPATTISASMHQVRRGRLSLNRLEYGASVRIDPGRLESFFLIQLPIQGSAQIDCDGQRFTSSPHCASVISPNTPVSMHWAANAPQIALRLERSEVEDHCAQHLGHRLDSPLQFAPAFDMRSCGGAYFLQLLSTLADALACAEHPIHQPLVLKQFESTLINALLYGQPNNLRLHQGADSQRKLSPHFVKRTEEYMLAHAHEPLSIEQLAEHAGVSVRTLFSGFREFRDNTPMAFLRDVRLERVRQALLQDTPQSVTDIALKWGFGHLGRFSQEYRKRYGELPSATLRFRRD